MKKEQWLQWKPAENLAKAHFVETIIDEMDRLIITLFESYEQNKTFQLIFDNTVIAYRSVDEGYRLMTPDNCVQNNGTNLWRGWTFFKASNSSYINWLQEQSDEKINLNVVTHFVVFAENFIVDVAAINEPIIKYID
jgi:hypothetical protein